MKRFWVFHPFLFAIFPVLFLFAENIDEVPATDLFLPMLVVIVGTLVLLLLLRLITKNYNKIAIIASSFLVLFFSYGHIRDLIYSWWPGRVNINLLLVFLWVVLFTTIAFLVIKSRRDFIITNKVLNVVAITLVAISLINIGIYEVKTFSLAPETTEVPETAGESPTSVDLEDSSNLPDIYYIIFDEYARQDTLEEFWDYDNSEFIDYLTSKGFYVASKSRSNYSWTCLSLPSSLNMEYFDYLSDKMRSQGRMAFMEMVMNNEAGRFLKSKGYRCIIIPGGGYASLESEYADEVVKYDVAFGIRISNFAYSLLRTTLLAPFEAHFYNYKAHKVLYLFEVLTDMPSVEGPKFVFAHIICPHPEYVFNRDGSIVKKNIWASQRRNQEEICLQEHQAYLEQLIFVSKEIETLIDELLSKSEVPPVIILQSDTGPGRQIDQPGRKLTEEAFMRERVEILNAYYFPDEAYDLLYESITPVNSFRVVFNHYFNTDYELLKDESYYGGLDFVWTIVPPEGDVE